MKIKNILLILAALLLFQPLLMAYNENEEGFPISFSRELIEPYKSRNAGFHSQADELENNLNDQESSYNNTHSPSDTGQKVKKIESESQRRELQKQEAQEAAEAEQTENQYQSFETANVKNSDLDGDPVRISQGAYEENIVDLSLGQNLLLELKRRYSSQNTITSSFAYGWTFNYDERILFGTLAGYRQAEAALTEYVTYLSQALNQLESLIKTSYSVSSIAKANSEYSARISSCSALLDRARGTHSSLGSLESSAAGYSAQSRIRGIKDRAESLVSSIESRLSSLQAGSAKLSKDLKLYKEYQEKYQAAQQNLAIYKEKVRLTEERKSLNIYSRFEGSPLWYEETGLDTITLIDDQGYPHILYESSQNSGFWQNADDKDIISCRKTSSGLKLLLQNGLEKTFDNQGFIIQIKDPNENSITISRKADEKISRIQSSWGETILFIYADNFISKIINERDQTQYTSYSYKTKTLTQVSNDYGESVTMEYDSDKRMKTKKYSDGSQISFSYGQITSSGTVLTTQTRDEEGHAEYFTYDPVKKITTYTDHDNNQTIYYYDNFHRTRKIIEADGSLTEYQYDDKGRIIRVIRNGDSTYYNYEGRKTRISYSDGSYELYDYDTFNLETYYRDRDGIVYEYIRDSKGNLTEYKIFGQTNYTQRFDQRGNVIQKTLYGQKPVITDYQYDSFDNLIKESCGEKESLYEYDSRNRLTKIIKNKETQSSFSYQGNKIIQTDLNGLETSYIINERNKIKDLIQKDKETGLIHKIHIEYDKRQLPLKIYSGDSQTQTLFTQYSYTPQGKISSQTFYDSSMNAELIKSYEYKNGQLERTSLKVPGQEEFSYKPDETNKASLQKLWSPAGRLKKEQNQWGGFYEYDYDIAGNLSLEKEENGQPQITSYYADGSIKSQTGKDGSTTSFSYDNQGRLISKTNGSYIQSFEYDSFDRMTKQIVSDSRTPSKIIYCENYEYSKDLRTVTITQGQKYKSIYELDAFGNIIKVTDGNGNTRQYEYDKLNRLIAAYDGYLEKTEIEYNSLGNIKAISLPDGALTLYEYNCLGQIIKVTDDCGTLYSAQYDKRGNLIKEKIRADCEKSYDYDQADNLIKMYYGGELIQSYSYNQMGKELTVTDGMGYNYLYEYDSFGRLLKQKNRLGKSQEFFYDVQGQIIKQKNFDNTFTQAKLDSNFTFDFMQNVTQAQNEYSKTIYEYDSGGRLILQKEVSTGEEIHYEYDRAGNRTRLYSSNCDTTYTYGKNNEVKKIFDNKQRVSVQLEYDSNGREVLRRFGNGTMEATRYDKAGRTILKTQTNSQGQILWGEGYIYGSDGKRTASVDAKARVTLFEYDKQGRLSAVYYPYTKEHEDLLKKQAQANGLSTNGQAASNHYLSTDQKTELSLRLNQLHYSLASSLTSMQLFIKEEYSYDKNGNCLAKINPFGKIDYSYDRENRLVSSGSNGQSFISYTYDDRGNLLMEESHLKKAEYAYNDQNRLIYSQVIDKEEKTFTQTKYAYDAFGRRILVQDFDQPAIRTLYDGLSFDVIKQSPVYSNGSFSDTYQTEIKIEAGGSATGDRYRFIYDDTNDGNRYFNLDDENYKAVSSRCKSERIQFSLNGSVTAQVSLDSGIDYFSTDLLGSICLASDNKGSPSQSYTYDAFGNLVQGSFSASKDFGYTGKQFDPSLLLYNYGLRDYNPLTTRFTTSDPIQSGPNWFTYCHNDPINFVDLWGLCEDDLIRRDLYFYITRDDFSKYSRTDSQYVGRDSITIKNTKTGDSFTLTGVQTYSNHKDYPANDTIQGNSGTFYIQYLGNNQEEGQQLYGRNTSDYKGPVFNVQYADTMGLSMTDKYGVIIDSKDKKPVRVHSDYSYSRTRIINKASGGCPIYDSEQEEAFVNFLERNNIKAGDRIKGYLKEYFEP